MTKYDLYDLRWPLIEAWRYEIDHDVIDYDDDDEILKEFIDLNEKMNSLREKCYEKITMGEEHHTDLMLLIDDLSPYLEDAITFLRS